MITLHTAKRIGIVAAIILIFVPAVDLTVAGWFYLGDGRFAWQHADWANGLQRLLHRGSIAVGIVLILGAVWTIARQRRLLGLDGRRWVFLFLALAIGPGLVANAFLKDNWGRARPRQIEAFGGEAHFSPPLVLSDQCRRNCSFVAGDPTVGWFAASFAYVVPPRRRRVVFWSAIGAGGFLGLMRIAMGGHFLSDVLFGAVIVLGVIAGLHALLFGARETRTAWAQFTRGLIRPEPPPPPDPINSRST